MKILLEILLVDYLEYKCSTIDNNIFRPIVISPDIRKAFEENAKHIGAVNPLEIAAKLYKYKIKFKHKYYYKTQTFLFRKPTTT